jgi:hypothetical protein
VRPREPGCFENSRVSKPQSLKGAEPQRGCLRESGITNQSLFDPWLKRPASAIKRITKYLSNWLGKARLRLASRFPKKSGGVWVLLEVKRRLGWAKWTEEAVDRVEDEEKAHGEGYPPWAGIRDVNRSVSVSYESLQRGKAVGLSFGNPARFTRPRRSESTRTHATLKVQGSEDGREP